MHFKVFVVGDKVDDQLGPHVSTDYEFIVSRELKSLFEENGVPYSADRVVSIVRDYVGRSGKVAIVAKDQVKKECPALYRSGIEDFLVLDNGQFVGVNRILYRKDTDVRDAEEQDAFEKVQAKLKQSDTYIPTFNGGERHMDSYVIGGQWANALIAKEGKAGRRGPDSPKVDGRFDRMKIKDIDFVAMYNEATAAASNEYDVVEEVLAGRKVKTLEEITEELRASGTSEMTLAKEASQVYHDQQPIKDLCQAGHYFIHNSVLEGKQAYLDHVARPAILPFAVVKDGVWYSRGKMEWFGMVADAKSWDEWEEEVKTLLTGVSQSTWLTVVDCHR